MTGGINSGRQNSADKKLEQFGICVSEGIEQFGEEQYFKELEQFVRGQEFLRLGQTVTRGQWSAARMTMRRIGQTMERLRMQSMKKFLPQLQNTFARKYSAGKKCACADDTETCADHSDFDRSIRAFVG